MATLPIKSIAEITNDQAVAIQAKSQEPIDFTVGSVSLAEIEATAGVAFWLQELIVILLATTRASTSVGIALDTFVGDYGLTRLRATKASGNVTFSRNVTTQSAFIPAGTTVGNITQVQTVVGNITFNVVPDTTNEFYNASLVGYVIPIGTASIPVLVQAVIGGTTGNVTENSITVLVGGISGINTVTNPLAFTNAKNEESDPQLRARFILYINSLSKATLGAIVFAVSSVQNGIQQNEVENKDSAGNNALGFFYVVIDDGTGDPPVELINSVKNAVALVRAFCIRCDVYAVTPTPVAFVVNAIYDSNYVEEDLQNAIIAQITNYIQGTADTPGLGIGKNLDITRIYQLAYNASPGILNVTSVTLNAGTSDITIDSLHRATINTITVNLTTPPPP